MNNSKFDRQAGDYREKDEKNTTTKTINDGAFKE